MELIAAAVAFYAIVLPVFLVLEMGGNHPGAPRWPARMPTAEEAGVRDLVSTVWNGVLVRAGTPGPIIERLNREIVAVLNDAAMRQSLEQQGFEVIPSTPEQFTALIRSDMPKMREVVARSGAKAE